MSKEDVNIRLKAVNRRAGKVKQEFTTITTRGVDSDGFTFTETRRVPIEQAEGDPYQDAAVLAREDNYVKQATKIGQNAGQVVGGVESQEEFDSGDVILNTSIGEVTDDIGLDNLTDPTTNLDYGPGSFSLNFANLDGDSDADAALISAGVTAEKLGGDSAQPLSSILDTLTGLGTATGKLTQKGSGLAVAGGGGINSIVSGVQEGISKQNQLKSDIDTAVSNIGSASDVTQLANVAQNVAKESYNTVAQAVTAVPSLKSGDISKGDLLGQVSNASGLTALNSVVSSAKQTLTKFPTVNSFIDTVTDITTSVNSLVSEITDFTDRIDGTFDKGLSLTGGILQDINESLTNKAGSKLNNLAGGGFQFDTETQKRLVGQIKGTSRDRSEVIKTVVTKNENVSERMKDIVTKTSADNPQDLQDKITNEALAQGIPQEDIDETIEQIKNADTEILALDTTISGTNVIDADFFAPSTNIDENASKWSGRTTKSDAFTYVSSVEELESEINSIERNLNQVIIHATETTTDKNIGAIEINNINKELDLDGIAYHYVIRRDGRLQRGRPVNKAGEHSNDAKIDRESIGVILVGGLNCSSGEPNPTNFRSSQSFTITQFNTLEKFLTAFYRRYPGGKVNGHNDIDANELDPYFDVEDYVSALFRKNNQ